MGEPALERVFKTCTKCGAVKQQTDFYKKGERLESICKECKKQKRRLDYRLTLTEKDKRRWAKVMNTVLDFYIARQDKLLNEIDTLIQKAKG